VIINKRVHLFVYIVTMVNTTVCTPWVHVWEWRLSSPLSSTRHCMEANWNVETSTGLTLEKMP